MKLYGRKVLNNFREMNDPKDYHIYNSDRARVINNNNYDSESFGFIVNTDQYATTISFDGRTETNGSRRFGFYVNVHEEEAGDRDLVIKMTLDAGFETTIFDASTDGFPYFVDVPISNASDIYLKFESPAESTDYYIINNFKMTDTKWTQINTIDDNAIKVTKSVKHIKELFKTRSGYSDKIMIPVDSYNSMYYSNESNNYNDVKNGTSGSIEAVIAYDDNSVVMQGTLIFKSTLIVDGRTMVECLFSEQTSDFFSKLTKDKISLEEYLNVTVSNSITDIQADFIASTDSYEDNERDFIYSTNLNGINGDGTSVFTTNKGLFSDCSCTVGADIDSLSLTSDTQNSNFIFDSGYSGHLLFAEPMLRIKPLFKKIHEKYGYAIDGAFIDNPAFYNLVLSTINPSKARGKRSNNDEAEVYSFISNHGSVIATTPSLVRYCYGKGYFSGDDPNHYRKVNHPACLLLNDNYNSLTNGVTAYTLSSAEETGIIRVTNFGLSNGGRLVDNYAGFEAINPEAKNHTREQGHHVFFQIPESTKGDMTVELSALIKDLGGANNDNKDSITYEFDLVVYDVLYNHDLNTIQDNPYSFYHNETVLMAEEGGGSGLLERTFTVSNFTLSKDDYYGFVVIVQENHSNKASAWNLSSTEFAGFSINTGVSLKVSIAKNNEFVVGNPFEMKDKALTVSEADVVKDIINKFNLYPIVDKKNKIIHYLSHDEFYLDSVVGHDWSNKVDYISDIVKESVPQGLAGDYKFLSKINGKAEMPVGFGELIKSTNNGNSTVTSVKDSIASNNYIKIVDVDNEAQFTIVGASDVVTEEEEEVVRFMPFQLRTASTWAVHHDALVDAVSHSYGYSHCYLNRRWSSDTEGKTTTDYGSVKKSVIGYINKSKVRYGNTGNIGWFDALEDNVSVNTLSPLNQLTAFPLYYPYNSYGYGYDMDTQATSLFDLFYKRQFDNMIDPTSHSYEAVLKLDRVDITNFSLRDKITIDGNKYIIEEISNFEEDELTKVRLQSWIYGGTYRTVFEGTTFDKNFFAYAAYGSYTNAVGIGFNEWQLRHPDNDRQMEFMFASAYHVAGATYRYTFDINIINTCDEAEFNAVSYNGEVNNYATGVGGYYNGLVEQHLVEGDNTITVDVIRDNVATTEKKHYVVDTFKLDGLGAPIGADMIIKLNGVKIERIG